MENITRAYITELAAELRTADPGSDWQPSQVWLVGEPFPYIIKNVPASADTATGTGYIRMFTLANGGTAESLFVRLGHNGRVDVSGEFDHDHTKVSRDEIVAYEPCSVSLPARDGMAAKLAKKIAKDLLPVYRPELAKWVDNVAAAIAAVEKTDALCAALGIERPEWHGNLASFDRETTPKIGRAYFAASGGVLTEIRLHSLYKETDEAREELVAFLMDWSARHGRVS